MSNAAQTPLKDLLRDIPKDARGWHEEDGVSQNIPFGRLAHEALAEIERLEAAVLAEREACAKVCEEQFRESMSVWPRECAAAIRARGDK